MGRTGVRRTRKRVSSREFRFDLNGRFLSVRNKSVWEAKSPGAKPEIHEDFGMYIVVDGRTAFVSSANFTEAAQERNIEVGALVRSQIIAERLITFFSALVSTGAARRAL